MYICIIRTPPTNNTKHMYLYAFKCICLNKICKCFFHFLGSMQHKAEDVDDASKLIYAFSWKMLHLRSSHLNVNDF